MSFINDLYRFVACVYLVKRLMYDVSFKENVMIEGGR